MNIFRPGLTVLLSAVFAHGVSALAADKDDKQMNALAKTSGCYFCHNVEPRKPAPQEILPYGPAWTDIARRYRGDANAADRLTEIVRQGTGKNLSERHWKNQTTVFAMMPNAVEITEPDAGRLVRWILTLGK